MNTADNEIINYATINYQLKFLDWERFILSACSLGETPFTQEMKEYLLWFNLHGNNITWVISTSHFFVDITKYGPDIML